MNKHIRQMASLMMIFIMLIQPTGCYSIKEISRSDLPTSKKYLYEIQGSNTKYQLEKVVISEGILSGKIILTNQTNGFINDDLYYVNTANNERYGNKIFIYLPSDSLMEINSNMILSVHLKDISKMEMRSLSAGKTIALVSSTVILLTITVLFILVSKSLRNPLIIK